LAQVYVTEGDFPKGESTLLRALRNFETLYGPEDIRVALPLNSLCYVYDQWGKPEKSEPCHARLVAMAEKQFGASSPYLLRDLTAEAQALRKLGRPEDAAKLEQRMQSLQSAQTNRN
jgi:hypothetical protein